MTFRDEYIEAICYLFGPVILWDYFERANPYRDYGLYISYFSSAKHGLAILRKLENLGIVETWEKTTPEFRKCLEKARKDMRIKDPKKYCLRKTPIAITIKINYDILKHYWEEWEKEGRPMSFPDWLLFYPQENANV